MGKNRHSKDRLFLTATEWRGIGGKPTAAGPASQALPFDHCALSLTRFETPCCSPEGVVFDLVHIVPYLRKYKKNPVSGLPMTTDEIVRLTMHKNAEDKWHCPVTFKVFNNNSRIVANRSSGHVYSYEAVHELNVKARNMTDLMTGEPFTKADILTLYDVTSPECMALRDISTFVHTRQLREAQETTKGTASGVRHNPTTSHIMQEIAKRGDTRETLKDIEDRHRPEPYLADVKAVLALGAVTSDVDAGSTFTSQKAGASLTSSAAEVSTSGETRLASAEDVRNARWKVLRKLGKKGFVQLQTTHGSLNIEVHCDMCDPLPLLSTVLV